MKTPPLKLSLLIVILLVVGFSWGCAPPTVKLKVSRDEVSKGEPVTVSWEAKKAKAIELDGRKVEKIGSETVTPAQTTHFEIVAKRGRKEARDKATVNVSIPAPAPSITLNADPGAIEPGQAALLHWSSENATAVNISGIGEVPGSGEREVSPRESTTYTADARGDGGTATASARVTVTEPPPPSTPPAEPAPVAAGPTIEELFANTMTPVFYDLDKSDLSRPEQEKLRRAAEWLLQEPYRSITFRVEGNCDPRGTAEYNLGLGDRRARSVKNFLVSLGVETDRIDVVSFGLEKAEGKMEGTPTLIPSWAHDRRADFLYLRSGQKPSIDQ